MDKLNKSTSIQYVLNLTQKYIQLKCAKCKKYAMWFKNVDNVDVEELMKNERLSGDGSVVVDMQFFRSINQNHNVHEHPEIEF